MSSKSNNKKNNNTTKTTDVKSKALAPPPPAVTNFEERITRLRVLGKKRGKRYMVIGIAVSFVIAMCGIYGVYYLLVEVIDITGQTHEDTATILINKKSSKENSFAGRARVCAKDMDCVETKADCCDCHSGGRQIAVNREYFNEWTEKLQGRCQNTGCMDLENCKEGKAVCEEGKCMFIEEKEEKNCAEKGDMINYPQGNSEHLPDACCEGLKGLLGFQVSKDGVCEQVEGGPFLICMPCGNGVCESVDNFNENKCNCPEDCEDSDNTSVVDEFTVEQDAQIPGVEDVDSDKDGLTDKDEYIYGTDPENADTDGDGFLDGDEVENGYNPRGNGKL